MKPEISVVIPCRNDGSTLTACLESIEGQELPRERFEVLVVDGGSTDGSLDVALGRPGVRLLHDGATGPSGARNVGIHAARGEIVAFTDADCMPRRDWLARLAEAFAEDPTLDGVGGGLRAPSGSLLGRWEDVDARVNYRGFITSNAAYRREALLAVGGFDESLQCAEDYDLAWRLLRAGRRVVHDPRPIVTHAPPEIASAHAYLLKQFWYARHDVPAHLREIRRERAAGRGSGGGAPPATGARSGFARALGDAASLVAVAAAPLSLRAAGVGVAAAAAGGVSKVLRTARGSTSWDFTPLETGAVVALETAKRLVRGAGTLAGLADVALAADSRLGPARAGPLGRAAPRVGVRSVPRALPKAAAR
jgi:hypothetical protein